MKLGKILAFAAGLTGTQAIAQETIQEVAIADESILDIQCVVENLPAALTLLNGGGRYSPAMMEMGNDNGLNTYEIAFQQPVDDGFGTIDPLSTTTITFYQSATHPEAISYFSKNEAASVTGNGSTIYYDGSQHAGAGYVSADQMNAVIVSQAATGRAVGECLGLGG